MEKRNKEREQKSVKSLILSKYEEINGHSLLVEVYK